MSWTDIQIPIGGGIDTKTSAKLVKPPKLVELTNAVFTSSPSYRRRNGYTALSDTAYRGTTQGTVTDLKYLATREEELLASDGKDIWSWNESRQAWSRIDHLIPMTINERAHLVNEFNQRIPEVVTHRGMRVTVWKDESGSGGSATSNIVYVVEDSETGAVIKEKTTIADTTGTYAFRLVPVNNYIHLYYHQSTANTLRLITISTITGAVSDQQVTATLNSQDTYSVWDCHPTVHNTVLVVYKDTSGTPVIQAQYRVDDGSQLSSPAQTDLAFTNAGTATKIACYHDPELDINVVGIVETTGNNFRCKVINADLTTYDTATALSVGATTHQISVAVDRANSSFGSYKIYAICVTSSCATRLWTSAGAGGAFSQQVSVSGARLASNMFWSELNETLLFIVSYASNLQSSYFVYEAIKPWGNNANGQALQGKIAPALGVGHRSPGGTSAGASRVVKVWPVSESSTRFCWPAQVRSRLTTGEEATLSDPSDFFANHDINLVTLDFSNTDIFSTAESGRKTFLIGGQLWQYDGVGVYEVGFNLYPEGITTTTSNATGTIDGTKTYSWRVFYEWFDASGGRQISTYDKLITVYGSGTGLGSAGTTRFNVGDDTVALVVPVGGIQHTRRLNSSVYLVGYRCEGDSDPSAGAPFYRINSPDPATIGTTLNGCWLADGNNVSDGLADASLIDNELDYISQGETDHVSPPSCSLIAEGNGRVYLAGFKDPNLVLYSKTRFAGALEFHDSNQILAPEDGGDITGLSCMDDKLLIFKKDRIYVTTGDGLNNQGTGGFYNEPQLLTADVGCTNPTSIVVSPQGILFQTDKGIYALTRDLAVAYVGQDVERYNSQSITAATVLNDVNQIRFLTDSGRTLVYDYIRNEWSTFTNHTGADALVWEETYVYSRTNGEVWVEDPENFTDNGGHFSLKFSLPHLFLTGNQGYSRVREVLLLGEFFSEHTIICRVYKNYKNVFDEGSLVPSDFIDIAPYGEGPYGVGPYGGSQDNVYQLRFLLPDQKGQAYRFEFEDRIDQFTPGRSYEVVGVTIKAQQKQGPFKLNDGRSGSMSGVSTQ